MAKRNIKKLVDELNAIFKENGYGTVTMIDASGFVVDFKCELKIAQFAVIMKLASEGIKEKAYGVVGSHLLVYKV